MSTELSGDDGDVEVYVGRQSVTLGRRGLGSVVISVGGMIGMLVMRLI